MKKTALTIFALATLWLSACNTSQQSAIPFSKKVEVEDTYTIIWNGTSEAYRYTDGKWIRAENYDYQFDVIQKRYDNQWKSVKSMHRIHPDYDGKAGNRDQTMYFNIKYEKLKDEKIISELHTSLGDGKGSTDKEFRNAVLNIYDKNASAFMPYNTVRITQKYDYEGGLLTETVELLQVKEGKETPFMKNEEKAYFYLKGKLSQAPTVFKN